MNRNTSTVATIREISSSNSIAKLIHPSEPNSQPTPPRTIASTPSSSSCTVASMPSHHNPHFHPYISTSHRSHSILSRPEQQILPPQSQSHSRDVGKPSEAFADRSLKRKEQNRNAQRAFRERKEKYMQSLEEKVKFLTTELEKRTDEYQRENERLRRVVCDLENELRLYKAKSYSRIGGHRNGFQGQGLKNDDNMRNPESGYNFVMDISSHQLKLPGVPAVESGGVGNFMKKENLKDDVFAASPVTEEKRSPTMESDGESAVNGDQAKLRMMEMRTSLMEKLLGSGKSLDEAMCCVERLYGKLE
ncbi:hypothetical protein BKA69DRAFT_1067045 [Paraphysoderma sedebokerense]|nr:hypothetical protein BKA69DRAFT_1067045 [Paraphysoderma sedebokerense]